MQMSQIIGWVESNYCLIGLFVVAVAWGYYQKRRADRLSWSANVITSDEDVQKAVNSALQQRQQYEESARKSRIVAEQQLCEAATENRCYRRAARTLFGKPRRSC